MRIDLEFVELHSALFILGTNFGEKLHIDPKKNKSPLTALYYDTDGTGQYTKLESVVVEYKGSITVLDSVASRTIKGVKAPEVIQVYHPQVAGVVVKAQIGGPKDVFTAQVSTPLDKVQGKPGRKPKYQGQESQGE